MEIKLAKGNVHIAGRVDLVVLRTALECLLVQGAERKQETSARNQETRFGNRHPDPKT